MRHLLLGRAATRKTPASRIVAVAFLSPMRYNRGRIPRASVLRTSRSLLAMAATARRGVRRPVNRRTRSATMNATRPLAHSIRPLRRSGHCPDTLAALDVHPELREEPSVVIDMAYEEYCLREQSGEKITPQ